MLIRDVNAPPKMSFIASIATSSSGFFGGTSSPAMIVDCSEPGRSTRNTRAFVARATADSVFFGTSPGSQRANSFSIFGRISGNVVSPTTISVALFGLNHVAWNFTRSSRVIAATDSSVPEPVMPIEYAWPSPYSRRGSTRSAIGVGVFFSSRMSASWRRFARSSSSVRNAGFRITSA